MTKREPKYFRLNNNTPLESFHGVMLSLQMKEKRIEDGDELWSDGKRFIQWIDEPRICNKFVCLFNSDSELEMYLSDKLDLQTLSEVVRFASKSGIDHNDLVDALFAIGYMVNKPTKELISLFVQKIECNISTIRRAALNAYMIRRFPSRKLHQMILEIASTDNDQDVVRTAKAIIEMGNT